MKSSAITKMLFEAVKRKFGGKTLHDAVAGHFGEDGGGSDRGDEAVAFDDCKERCGEDLFVAAVDEGEIGLGFEGAQGEVVGHLGGAQNVVTVD